MIKRFKFLIIVFFLFLFLFTLNFENLNILNNSIKAQSKFFLNPQSTTIAIISEIEGFTKTNVSGEILKGMLALKKEFPISLVLLTPESYEKVDSQFKLAIQSNVNIIIGYGNQIKNEFIKYANNNPNIFFIGIDLFSSDIELDNFNNNNNIPNLCLINYKEEEAGFLAGVFAGLLTKDYSNISNRLNPESILGIILAKKDDSKVRYEFGFRLGALFINNKCQILNFELEDENDFYLIRKNTSSLYQSNVDIVFQLCGKGSPAAIQAAYLSNNFIIGYEFDQNIYAPENVITSAIKKVSSSIYYLIKNSFLLGFSSGNFRLGVKDGAVGLASFHEFDLVIPQQIKDAIYSISTAIAEGKISIPFVSLTMKNQDETDSNQVNTNKEEDNQENSPDQTENSTQTEDDQK